MKCERDMNLTKGQWFCPNCGSTEVLQKIGSRIGQVVVGIFLAIVGASLIGYGYALVGSGAYGFFMGTYATTGTFAGALWSVLGFIVLLVGIGIALVARRRTRTA